MRVDALDYTLPEELIAQVPAREREQARLLVLQGGQGSQRLVESTVGELASFVPEGALVVVNDTRVMKARLLGHKVPSGGKAEIFLLRRRHGDEWLAMGRPSKSLRNGTRISVGSLDVTVLGRDPEEGLLRVALATRDASLVDEAIQREGHVPLPPYIKREDAPMDEDRYQTIFAREPGAVAAPTAGLHVTRGLLRRLEERGCEIAAVTLHVGLGTFSPVTVDDLDVHPMHGEAWEVSRKAAAAVAQARARGAPVVAIGTTAVRALETAADPEREGYVRPGAGETRLLIQPGYRFRVVDHLFTNFHLPRSTLLALVCALGGTERVLGAYRHAIAARFRFYSYGDAMLLARTQAP